MHRYEREIDRVLAPYYRLGFIEYDASKAFVDKVLDYLSCTIPPLIKRFCTMEALELVNIVAVNAAELSLKTMMTSSFAWMNVGLTGPISSVMPSWKMYRSCINGLYIRWMPSKIREMSYTVIMKKYCIMISMTRRP